MSTTSDQASSAGLVPPLGLLATVQTPVLAVDLARVRANVACVLDLVGGADRWRPHVKTTKTPEIWAELARAGIRRFKCATTREARYLAETLVGEGLDAPDICCAYPLRAAGLAALGAIARDFPAVRFSVLCEDAPLAAEIPTELGVFVDVNLGMDRTGVPADERDTIVAIARAAADRDGDEGFRGVHGYEGHLHDGTLDERRAALDACYDELIDLCRELMSQGVDVGELVTSGTPGFQAAVAYEPLAAFVAHAGIEHRVSPGTVVLHDARSDEQNGDIGLRPAACVWSRVISTPAPGIVTSDAGSKSIAAEAGDPCARVVGRPGLRAMQPSEEHLPLRVEEGEAPERGEVLSLVPLHVCPTVNLAEEMLLIDGDEVRRVAVRARAHD